MTAYVPTHGGPQGFFTANLGNPVPPSGSLGSLRLSGSFPVKIRVGDKIIVNTAGAAYAYYSLVEILTGYTWSEFIAVSPAIQTTHVSLDFVFMSRMSVGKMLAMNAIVSVNCSSADISVPGAFPNRRRGVLPWVRDWPWTADPYGIPWDQSNIMALMLKPVYNSVDFDDPAAGMSWNIPVPRAIGSEYTKFSPRSLGQSSGDYRQGARAGLDDYDVFFPTENRTADSVRSWLTIAVDRRGWRPFPQVFTFVLADPDDTASPNKACYAGESIPGVLSTNIPSSGDVERAPGCRGGRYSFCVSTGGTGATVNMEIMADVPGLGAVVLCTVACVSGSGPVSNWGPIYTGTWAGVVLPTDGTGTTCLFYVRPSVNCLITFNSNVRIAASTQVPWAHHVVTGNLVAPGGLIAPFY